jgi:uncharacterized protein YndB with AHSA1/START domain
VTDVVVTRLIAASPATVFSFFTDVERWTYRLSIRAEGGDPGPDSPEMNAAPTAQ